jgi:hypothetical protein
VVTRDLPPNVVAVGNPARVIKHLVVPTGADSADALERHGDAPLAPRLDVEPDADPDAGRDAQRGR